MMIAAAVAAVAAISPSPFIAKDRARIAQQIAASILSYDEDQK